MNINWKRIKTFIKFHLGMKCVVQYGDKWVVTHKAGFMIREFLDTGWEESKGGFWWMKGWEKNWSLFNTEEDAINALEKHSQIISKPQPKFKI